MSDDAGDKHIRFDIKDGVGTITIDRADKKNALTVAMYADFKDALDQASKDPAVRVVRVRGAGDIFTSGNDIGDFMNLAEAIKADPAESAVVQLLFALVDFEKPLVGEIRGAAIGIGTTMLLHFDLVYAGGSARFHMPFVTLGVCPEGASSLLLPRVAGQRRAAELLMLAERFDGETAREVGIVNRVLPDEELKAYVDAKCKKIVALPAASVRATKYLLRASNKEAVRAHIMLEVEHFAERLTSPEAAEAFSSFIEKRAPDFTQFA